MSPDTGLMKHNSAKMVGGKEGVASSANNIDLTVTDIWILAEIQACDRTGALGLRAEEKFFGNDPTHTFLSAGDWKEGRQIFQVAPNTWGYGCEIGVYPREVVVFFK